VIDFHVLTILFIWTMLVAYHRLYDTLILMFFIVLVFKGLSADIWKLKVRDRVGLLAFMAVTPLILILPARIVDKVLPDYYGTISDAVTTILFLIMLSISMLLLRRFLQNMQTETTQQRTESHDIRNDPHRDTRPRWANNS